MFHQVCRASFFPLEATRRVLLLVGSKMQRFGEFRPLELGRMMLEVALFRGLVSTVRASQSQGSRHTLRWVSCDLRLEHMFLALGCSRSLTRLGVLWPLDPRHW